MVVQPYEGFVTDRIQIDVRGCPVRLDVIGNSPAHLHPRRRRFWFPVLAGLEVIWFFLTAPIVHL